MPCRNCDHTMSKLGVTEDALSRPVWWCPRCGTSQLGDAGGSITPMLVDRTRRLLDRMLQKQQGSGFEQWFRDICHTLGIFESIYTPGERPKHDPL